MVAAAEAVCTVLVHCCFARRDVFGQAVLWWVGVGWAGDDSGGGGGGVVVYRTLPSPPEPCTEPCIKPHFKSSSCLPAVLLYHFKSHYHIHAHVLAWSFGSYLLLGAQKTSMATGLQSTALRKRPMLKRACANRRGPCCGPCCGPSTLGRAEERPRSRGRLAGRLLASFSSQCGDQFRVTTNPNLDMNNGSFLYLWITLHQPGTSLDAMFAARSMLTPVARGLSLAVPRRAVPAAGMSIKRLQGEVLSSTPGPTMHHQWPHQQCAMT